jgi:hypothetical protein
MATTTMSLLGFSLYPCFLSFMVFEKANAALFKAF